MKKKLLLLGLMIISMLFCVSCKSQEQKVTEQMELAEKYLLEGNYEAAVVAFQKVLEIEPRSIAAYTGLVKVYDENSQYEEAVAAIELGEAVLQENEEVDRGQAEAFYLYAGEFYEKYGKLEETINILERGFVLLGDEVIKNPLIEAYTQLAEHFIEQKDYEKAISVLEKGISVTDGQSLRELLKTAQEELVKRNKSQALLEKASQVCMTQSKDEIESFMRTEDFQEIQKEITEPIFYQENDGKTVGIYSVGLYFGGIKEKKRNGEGNWYRSGDEFFESFKGNWMDDYPNGYGELEHYVYREHYDPFWITKGNYTKGYENGEMREEVVSSASERRAIFSFHSDMGERRKIAEADKENYYVYAYEQELGEAFTAICDYGRKFRINAMYEE